MNHAFNHWVCCTYYIIIVIYCQCTVCVLYLPSFAGNRVSEGAECAPPGGLYVQCVEEAGLRRGLSVALPVHWLRAGQSNPGFPLRCLFLKKIFFSSCLPVHSFMEGKWVEKTKTQTQSPIVFFENDEETTTVYAPVLTCSGSQQLPTIAAILFNVKLVFLTKICMCF